MQSTLEEGGDRSARTHLPSVKKSKKPEGGTSLTDSKHPNAKHYAIEEHEERLTVGDRKNCVKSKFRIRALIRKN